MKKAQVLKFWEELEDSTMDQEVIDRYKNRHGYDSERNLQRYIQVSKGFKNGETAAELEPKMTWSQGPHHPLLPKHAESQVSAPGEGAKVVLPYQQLPGQSHRHRTNLQVMERRGRSRTAACLTVFKPCICYTAGAND